MSILSIMKLSKSPWVILITNFSIFDLCISDLHTIEGKVNFNQYKSLAEFIGDITKIFENCRYFNPQGTVVAKAAENLEAFLALKIGGVRDKVTQNK